MEELVRDRVEDVLHHAGRAKRHPRRDHGAVAMLHAVAAAPRHVVAEERVDTAVELRKLAIDGALLLHDLFRARDVLVHFGVAGVVMDRDANRLRLPSGPSGLRTVKRADRLRAQLGRTVHEVLEVRGRERPAIAGRKELRRRHPVEAFGRLEGHTDRPAIEAARPQEGRRHVHVRVRRIDREVGAVDVVAVDLVDDAHGAVVAADVPPIRIGPRRLQHLALPVERAKLEDVLRVFVDRVAAGRRPAHARLERAGRHVGKRHVDLGVVMLGGERDAIGHWRLRRRGRRQRDEAQHESAHKTHQVLSRGVGGSVVRSSWLGRGNW